MSFLRKVFFHSPLRYLAAFLISALIGLAILMMNGFDQFVNYVNAFSVGGALTFLFASVHTILIFLAYHAAQAKKPKPFK